MKGGSSIGIVKLILGHGLRDLDFDPFFVVNFWILVFFFLWIFFDNFFVGDFWNLFIYFFFFTFFWIVSAFWDSFQSY